MQNYQICQGKSYKKMKNLLLKRQRPFAPLPLDADTPPSPAQSRKRNITHHRLVILPGSDIDFKKPALPPVLDAVGGFDRLFVQQVSLQDVDGIYRGGQRRLQVEIDLLQGILCIAVTRRDVSLPGCRGGSCHNWSASIYRYWGYRGCAPRKRNTESATNPAPESGRRRADACLFPDP